MIAAKHGCEILHDVVTSVTRHGQGQGFTLDLTKGGQIAAKKVIQANGAYAKFEPKLEFASDLVVLRSNTPL